MVCRRALSHARVQVWHVGLVHVRVCVRLDNVHVDEVRRLEGQLVEDRRLLRNDKEIVPGVSMGRINVYKPAIVQAGVEWTASYVIVDQFGRGEEDGHCDVVWCSVRVWGRLARPADGRALLGQILVRKARARRRVARWRWPRVVAFKKARAQVDLDHFDVVVVFSVAKRRANVAPKGNRRLALHRIGHPVVATKAIVGPPMRLVSQVRLQ